MIVTTYTRLYFETRNNKINFAIVIKFNLSNYNICFYIPIIAFNLYNLFITRVYVCVCVCGASSSSTIPQDLSSRKKARVLSTFYLRIVTRASSYAHAYASGHVCTTIS